MSSILSTRETRRTSSRERGTPACRAALEGILTTTDFVDIVAKSQPKAQTTVERYMTTDVITAGAQDSILSVAESMTEHGFHHMPVVDEEEGVIGMIATSDLAAYLSQTGQLARS
ncbi:CBS domain-containing protein [Haloferax volcanii]|uniref:CBS domain-containing protein n=1 Tax=Haloferax volcanii TaxID=2246 RepID=UPI0021BDD66B|nr:CBS domain-containing protein [Haloferax volcanii]